MGGYREGIHLSIRLGSLGSVVSSPSEVRVHNVHKQIWYLLTMKYGLCSWC